MSTLNFHFHYIPETSSTNVVAASLPLSSDPDIIQVVHTDFQTAGRGESGGWESERGKNLLFTLSFAPLFLPPRMQFALSEIAALAIRDTLALHCEGVTIKWPNDIYIGDCKACGILMEHNVEGGRLARTLVGAGVNVNQCHFRSDAPNPVSLMGALGHPVNRDRLFREELLPRFGALYEELRKEVSPASCHGVEALSCHQHFVRNLYRLDGKEHPFSDVSGHFMARVKGVEPDGRLCLERGGGSHFYAFKEVRFLPEQSARTFL